MNEVDPQTALPLEPKMSGALAYAPCCIGLVYSVFAIVAEKGNKFVRFHAAQSLALHGVWIAVWLAWTLVTTLLSGVLGFLASLLGLFYIPLGLAFLVLMIVLMAKAYGGETWRLPVMADLADKLV